MALMKMPCAVGTGENWTQVTESGLTTTPYEYECTDAVFAIGNPEADSYCMFGEVVNGTLNKYRSDTSAYVVTYTSGKLRIVVDQSRPSAHLVVAFK